MCWRPFFVALACQGKVGILSRKLIVDAASLAVLKEMLVLWEPDLLKEYGIGPAKVIGAGSHQSLF